MSVSRCYDMLIIVVNYNSINIIGIEKLLLRGISELNNYVNTLLLLLDNNSNDGSRELLSKYASLLEMDYKTLRLNRNYGFARAVNLGYIYASRKYCFRYVMLVNNDAVIAPYNTMKVVEYLEYNDIGGVQGTIMQAYNPKIIDNTGFIIDTFGLNYPVCRGYTIECSRMYFPSYLSGAHSMYKRELIDKIGGKPFSNYFEGYFDDRYLGLLAWAKGYKLLHVPLITTYHLGSQTYSGIDRVVKSTRWFENIVLSDLVSSSIISNIGMAILTYMLSSLLASILKHKNYVKSLINAYRRYKLYTSKYEYEMLRKLINNTNIPLLRKKISLRSHLKGIDIKMVIDQ